MIDSFGRVCILHHCTNDMKQLVGHISYMPLFASNANKGNRIGIDGEKTDKIHAQHGMVSRYELAEDYINILYRFQQYFSP